MQGSLYSDEQRQIAINLIATGRALAEISKDLGIPVGTLADWRKKAKNSENFKELQEQQKKTFEEKTAEVYERILEKSTKNLEKALDADKVSPSVLVTTIGVIHDKHALLTGGATGNVQVSFENMPI